MYGRKNDLQSALRRRFIPLASALVVVIAAILMLTWVALRIQVSLAGFLNGESVWSKAQKQAVIDLLLYARSGDPQEYAAFVQNYGLLQSDRRGRNEVQQPTYNKKKVDEAFRRGDVMLDAESGMIFMLRHMHQAPYFKDALADWRATDALLLKLGTFAGNLRDEYTSGSPSAATLSVISDRLKRINSEFVPLDSNFSLQMARGVQWAGRILFLSVSAAALIAILLWLWMAHRLLSGIRDGEERYRVLFDNAPDAIVMVDEHTGHIIDANLTAGAWTGRDPRWLLGATYERLFEQCNLQEVPKDGYALSVRSLQMRPVETASRTMNWDGRMVRQAIIRDVSERIERERSQRIALEALSNIREGVMIADAARRVISVNRAALLITGYGEADLVGGTLGRTRRLPDGRALPQTVWSALSERGAWFGEVQNRRHNGETYPERISISTICGADQHILYYVVVFSDISQVIANRHRLEQLALHDPMTGLVNRDEFQNRCDLELQEAHEKHHIVAILFIDLDGFKAVNDSYTHAAGDRLLVMVGNRIRNELREGSVAGRIGGDEFTVMVPDFRAREDAGVLADRLLTVLAEPFHINGYEIEVGASIGIATFPLDGSDSNTLIANADAAMYAAKEAERDTWRFYGPMLTANIRRMSLLATELHRALHENELNIVYQPSVEMQSMRVVAVEALIRWQHPERGEILPEEFIGAAEQTGVIRYVDDWVLQTVCAQIHAWDQAGVPPVRVAINVSARWFARRGFVRDVHRLMTSNGIGPNRLVLEVTERTILRAGDDIERTLRALAALGVAVAIDDFGTGYASMAYLKLPGVAFLKIDRSFVMGLPGSVDDAAIATAVLAMARSLQLETIAEGVETRAQHDFLLRAGCEEGQGFLYSYPVPPNVMQEVLRGQKMPNNGQL